MNPWTTNRWTAKRWTAEQLKSECGRNIANIARSCLLHRPSLPRRCRCQQRRQKAVKAWAVKSWAVDSFPRLWWVRQMIFTCWASFSAPVLSAGAYVNTAEARRSSSLTAPTHCPHLRAQLQNTLPNTPSICCHYAVNMLSACPFPFSRDRHAA